MSALQIATIHITISVKHYMDLEYNSKQIDMNKDGSIYKIEV